MTGSPEMTGADAELLMWRCHGQNGAGVPCAPQSGTWCGQHPFSRRVRRGYMAHSSSCLDDLAAEPPAHYRLVSGHDLFRDVACNNCTAQTAASARRVGDSAGPANNRSSSGPFFCSAGAVLPSRPCAVAVHGAQRRSRTAAWPPVGFILDRSEHRATLVAAAGSVLQISEMLRTARGIVVRMD